MKRFVCLLLVLLMVFSLSGCSILYQRHEDAALEQNFSEITESSDFEKPASSVAQPSSSTTSVSSKKPDKVSSQTPSISKKTYLADFIGKTVGDVKKAYNYNFKFMGYTGSSAMYSDDLRFFFILDGFYDKPSDSCKIFYAISGDSTELVEGLSGAMTYGQIKSVVGSYVTLAQPEYYENLVDGGWEYSVHFDYKGLRFTYKWYQDPNTSKSAEGSCWRY